jgi:serine/threonine-protein kinase RsbW
MMQFASTLDSTLESVDAAEESVRRFAEQAGFAESDRYFIGLAAREILVNAVKHGNRLDPAKQVELRLSADSARLTVEIKDHGEGFRIEDVPDPRLEENLGLPSGRGLMLARGIMDDFHVESGSAGTYVRMSKNVAAGGA